MSNAMLVRILAVSISTSLLVPMCAAEGLVGAQRNSFVKGNYESCMQNWAANPDSASLPADMGGKFCMCSANRLADKTPAGDLNRLNERMVQSPGAAIADLQSIVKEITDYCADRVISDAKK
jgi:hypothetical protein